MTPTTKPYTIVGIDPGLTGAIAVIANTGEIIELCDMPTMTAEFGKGNVVNPYGVASIIKRVKPKIAYIERVGARPGQGVSSMFKFGAALGILQGVVAANNISTEYVTPQAWKKFFGLIGQPKDAARTLCQGRYDYLAEELKWVKNGGRADALLIGLYGLTQYKEGS